MTATTAPKKVAIIIGSTRAVRIGPSVASLLKGIIEESLSSSSSPAVTLTLVDLASFHLPVFDEAVLPATAPAMGAFAHAHTIAWNDAVAAYDAYIIVTAEYNFGLPGALKNAIDYLYHAWIGKPVMVVSYGIKGGATAGAQLEGTLKGMHLKVVEKRVALEFPGRDEANHNMSPGLMKAMGGVLGEDVVEAWKGRGEEVLEAWEELRGLLVQGDEEKAKATENGAVKEDVAVKA